ncbi:MAG: hypothetical protein IT373_19420 [Polyangiaceae bacterium]|nr:hypothetical protein [Polyangiaceae bacterium]
MSDDKIDLSVLDPTHDGPRWERLVVAVAERGRAARRRRLTVSFQLVAWLRPALAAAACLGLLGGVAIATSAPSGATPTTASAADDPAFVLAAWAATSERPDTAEILRVLGASHGTD